MNRTHAIAIVTCALICSACSTSILYDPTLRMPARQLQTSEVQGTFGWGMLPETRPDAIDGKLNDDALLFDARAGLSKRVTLQARTWLGVPINGSSKRWGMGGSILYTIDTGSTGWRSSILLSGALGVHEETIQGFGGALNVILYTPKWLDVQPYLSAGGILAFSSNSLDEWGIAPLLHAGVSWEFLEDVGLNAEVTSIFQINVAENVYHTIITPTLSLYVRL